MIYKCPTCQNEVQLIKDTQLYECPLPCNYLWLRIVDNEITSYNLQVKHNDTSYVFRSYKKMEVTYFDLLGYYRRLVTLPYFVPPTFHQDNCTLDINHLLTKLLALANFI